MSIVAFSQLLTAMVCLAGLSLMLLAERSLRKAVLLVSRR